MARNIVNRWRSQIAAMGEDEAGAETLEIILFLAIFVLGMVGVLFFIRSRAQEKGSQIGNCINNANTAQSC